MAITPDPARLRELSDQARSIDFEAEAWTSVGQHLDWALGQKAMQSRTSSQG